MNFYCLGPIWFKDAKNPFKIRRNCFQSRKAPLYLVYVRKQQKWCRFEGKSVIMVDIIIRFIICKVASIYLFFERKNEVTVQNPLSEQKIAQKLKNMWKITPKPHKIRLFKNFFSRNFWENPLKNFNKSVFNFS